MRRREFIGLFGSAAAAWPFSARAQSSSVATIGFLNAGAAAAFADRVAGFRQGLSEAGYLEGKNVAIEYRWAEGKYDRLPGLVDDLISRRVSVIVATGNTPAAVAAKAATASIPILFVIADDPVKVGLVASLNRPGGNATGVSMINKELAAKRLQLLHDLVPTADAAGLIVNPNNATAESDAGDLQKAAAALGLTFHVLRIGTDRDFDSAFATLVKQKVGALVVPADPYFNTMRAEIIRLAAHHALPTIYFDRSFVSAGGLISYGGSLPDAYRQVGLYTGRILKGEKPSDLPVMQPTRFELVINLKTAKALGLSVPQSFLVAADEVIE